MYSCQWQRASQRHLPRWSLGGGKFHQAKPDDHQRIVRPRESLRGPALISMRIGWFPAIQKRVDLRASMDLECGRVHISCPEYIKVRFAASRGICSRHGDIGFQAIRILVSLGIPGRLSFRVSLPLPVKTPHFLTVARPGRLSHGRFGSVGSILASRGLREVSVPKGFIQ